MSGTAGEGVKILWRAGFVGGLLSSLLYPAVRAPPRSDAQPRLGDAAVPAGAVSGGFCRVGRLGAPRLAKSARTDRRAVKIRATKLCPCARPQNPSSCGGILIIIRWPCAPGWAANSARCWWPSRRSAWRCSRCQPQAALSGSWSSSSRRQSGGVRPSTPPSRRCARTQPPRCERHWLRHLPRRHCPRQLPRSQHRRPCMSSLCLLYCRRDVRDEQLRARAAQSRHELSKLSGVKPFRLPAWWLTGRTFTFGRDVWPARRETGAIRPRSARWCAARHVCGNSDDWRRSGTSVRRRPASASWCGNG